MKLRNDFVSNSSTCAFILAIGVIRDFDKFNKWYKELSLGKNLDIMEQNNLTWPIEKKLNYFVVSNFMSEVLVDKADCLPEDKLVALSYSEDMIVDEDDCDNDQVCWNYFSSNITNIVEGMHAENGIVNVDYTFGCGRNG